MAIEIREFVGAESVHFRQSESKVDFNLTEWHADQMIDEDSIMVDIEGIHSKITRNYTYYEPNCLKESVPYWTTPYERPVIMHHNERDGIIIGRIKATEYTDKQTRSGTPALTFTVNIPHEEGKKGIKNGTLSTVSIGAIAHDVRCSVCGTNLAEHGLCEHEKGETYDGKLCYWIIKKMEPKELSYVIVPSDIYAHNLRVYKPQNSKAKVVGESTDKSEVTRRMFENPFADIQVVEATEEKETKVAETKQEEPKTEETVKEEPKTEETKVEETKEDVKVDEEVKGEEEGEVKEEIKEDSKEEESKEEEKKEDEKQDSEKDEKIKELEKEVEALKDEIKNLHKKVDAEKKLRESAETELIGFRLEKKKALVEEVNSLRAELNLEAEDTASLMESTEESLGLTIKNLKEFTNVAKNILNIPKVNSNVAISEDVDNTSKDFNPKEVKESNVDSNIDYEKTLVDILTGAWN